MAFRFVVRNAEARVVKFHELVAHFETVATGIERLLEFTLSHNCLLFGFREVVFVLSRVQTETIVQTGEVVAVEVEYRSFRLRAGQFVSSSRSLEVFGRLFGAGNIINDDARLKYFGIISNGIFIGDFVEITTNFPVSRGLILMDSIALFNLRISESILPAPKSLCPALYIL